MQYNQTLFKLMSSRMQKTTANK